MGRGLGLGSPLKTMLSSVCNVLVMSAPRSLSVS